MRTVSVERPVAKAKKTTRPSDTKRYGTLIRVTDEFAESVRKASAAEDMTVGEFATRYFQAIADKRYRDAILKEAKRLEGEK